MTTADVLALVAEPVDEDTAVLSVVLLAPPVAVVALAVDVAVLTSVVDERPAEAVLLAGLES